MSFISKYDLESSTAVLKSIRSLIQKELVNKQFDKEGKAFYTVYDVILLHWLKQLN